jgi:hypothetical protein
MIHGATSASPGGDLVPYPGSTGTEPFFLGPLEEATRRLNEALARGTCANPQIHPMPDGKVLLITEVHPTTGTGTSQVSGVSRLRNWPLYCKAALAVPAVAVLAVTAYLFVVGLMALVAWGAANALAIGVFVLCGFVGVLVFLGALARARHGHPSTRGGGYR